MNTRLCDLGIAKAGRGSAIGGKANRAQPQPRKAQSLTQPQTGASKLKSGYEGKPVFGS